RELLTPLAEELNQRPVEDAIQITISFDENRLKFKTGKTTDQNGSSVMSADQTLVSFALQWSNLRRQSQALERSSTARNIHNEIFALERLEKRIEKRKWKNPDELEQLARLPVLKDLSQNIKSIGESITQNEEKALLALYGKVAADKSENGVQVATVTNQWQNL